MEFNKKRDFNLYKPRIFNRKNTIFMNQIVFSQVIGVLIYKRNYSKEDAIDIVRDFIRKNNISVIRERDINIEEHKINSKWNYTLSKIY